MAKNVKIQYAEINNLLSEVQARIDDINTVYNNINKNGALVNDSWRSKAALDTINEINKQKDKLKKAVDVIAKQKDVILSTSKKIIEIDNDLAKKFSNALN